jgi:thiol:disulfide interchange protein DsbA
MRKLVSLIAIVLLSAVNGACGMELQEKKNFVSYNPPRPTEAQDRIEVIEFFWYGCSHCFDFEPALHAWVKKLPADVAFRRVPAVFPRSGQLGPWAPAAAFYYSLEAMDLAGKLHGDVFSAIHNERRTDLLNDKAAMAAWLGRKGIDTKAFLDAYESFSVHSKVARSMQLSDQAYNLDGVPAIIVDGRYRALATSDRSEDYLATVDALIDKVRKERGAKKK